MKSLRAYDTVFFFPSQQEPNPEDTEDPFSEDSDPFVDLADYK